MSHIDGGKIPGSSDVSGPGSSTDNALARWDGAAGDTIQNSTVILDDSGNLTGVTSITIGTAGLKLFDTNASHTLAFVVGSNLTANRTLTITTGDASRALTINGDATLNDWFDQSVKQAASPTFAGLTLSSPLTVPNGGTGVATLTGLVKGNGAAAFSAAAQGTDYWAPGGTDVAVADGGTGASTAADARTNLGAAASGANTDITSVYLDNSGLKIKDTNASHGLIFAVGSNITADRTLTITPGDADRTLTISGNATINDWFDQSVKVAATPTFAGLNISGSNGADYNPGSDTDTDIITVGVTGTPRVFWDESEDNFAFTKGIQLASGGNIRNGTANATRTLILTAAGGAPTTTIGCGGPTKVEAGTNDIDYWALEFDTSSEERAFWNVLMPDNYDGGTVTARFIWTNAGGASTETVRWGIKARAYADDAAIDQAYGSEVTVDDTWLAQGDVHVSAASSAITIGGSPAGGQWVVFNVGRKVANDNMAGDARLLAVQIEYGINAYSD